MAGAQERSSPSNGVSAALSPGSFTTIMGPSGSGKSTLLNVAAGLDRPTSGSVALGRTDLAHLSERRLTILRRERIGFVFQAFNLLPSLTVAQNIALPLRLDGRRPRRSAVREIAARVGLEKRLRDRPWQLSGGQQQRVALMASTRRTIRAVTTSRRSVPLMTAR